MEEKIKANAEFVIRQFTPLSGPDFGYNAQSVAWVDGFIERQRKLPDPDPAAIDGLVNVLGSYLGECIIRCFGGRWQQTAGGWSVGFDDRNAVYPFSKVRKQFANGPADSIKSFFDAVPALFAPFLKKSAPPADLERLERFVRQAEEAYDRLYEEWSRSDRAAAYNECKENMAEAIRLARRMGLPDKAAELEKKREHYKNVFDHQMNF